VPTLFGMERCDHDLDATWCYLCRVDQSGAPQAAWGVADDPTGREFRAEPMGEAQADYLRFLCEEFGYSFEPDLTMGEADLLVESFLNEPMTPRQVATLAALAAEAHEAISDPLTYAEARRQIRALVARRALRHTA
jgi:hypothetical protein